MGLRTCAGKLRICTQKGNHEVKLFKYLNDFLTSKTLRNP